MCRCGLVLESLGGNIQAEGSGHSQLLQSVLGCVSAGPSGAGVERTVLLPGVYPWLLQKPWGAGGLFSDGNTLANYRSSVQAGHGLGGPSWGLCSCLAATSHCPAGMKLALPLTAHKSTPHSPIAPFPELADVEMADHGKPVLGMTLTPRVIQPSLLLQSWS